ncbi:methyl-accepting chemotaxis protein [Natronorubrum texcoconense]|uniref:Methyl-accepting chemotaxis protein n=1 Tax=Natronorubrum texcoconense TaxID=1095776 RepID=A0A1G8UWG9_9EURY|nr:methyl-accepting chemotaxis protein [Natronorubrum texcoconense]SDJ58216.1 methyl-accepting chemotaxis protein [Natronorubrum texcoconense]
MLDSIRRIVPSTIRRSYALKFGIALLLLGLSVGAIGFVATAQITDSVEENALEDQQSLAAQEANTIDNWDEENERRTASTSDTPVVESGDEEAIQSYLYDLQLELSGQVEAIHYVDQESHELLATTTSDAATLEDVEFPEPHRIDSEISASNVERTEPYAVDDTPVVSYYISTGGQDDTAIVVSFELEHVMTDLGATVEGERSTVVVDREGQIILDDRLTGSGADGLQDGFVDSGFQTAYADEHPLLDEALAGENATHSGSMTFDEPPVSALQSSPHDFDPDGYVAAYHGTETGWVVLSHTSTEEAYGFVNSVNQYGTMATLGGVLLIGLVGAVIGRSTATSIDRLTDKVGQMEEGDLDVEFETKRIDNIGRLYDGFGSMRDELKLQITEAEDARADAERERERVERINDDLKQAATTYCGVMEDAADGDLTVRMDPNASDNETMEAIAVDFNEMLTEIEATVEHLNRFATDVATASEQVTASSEEVRSASEQVSASVQEISDGADQQYESLRSVDAEMNNLSTTTEEIAASSNEVADVAERTAQTGRDGRKKLDDAIEACEELERDRDAVVEEFDQLRDEVATVDELIDRIAEIAEQTNMLALNANIEASRSAAGDDGGFAAVAAEVKELSQDVKTATDEISARLEEIQDQTERSAEEVDQTSEEIEEVNELVTNAGSALEEIAEYAQKTNDGVQSISAATEEQAASTQEVVAMVDEVATISEETTAEAENVAASAEEQTSALSEVSESADDLSQQAVTLSEALDRFETDTDGSASGIELESLETATGAAVVGDAPTPDGDAVERDEDAGEDTFSFGEETVETDANASEESAEDDSFSFDE